MQKYLHVKKLSLVFMPKIQKRMVGKLDFVIRFLFFALIYYQLIEYISEVIYILIIIHSDKKAVKQFLEELKEIIENSNFDIVNNLLLIKKKKNTGYAYLSIMQNIK